MTENSNFRTTIGLAAKAGKVICGTPLVCEAMRGAKKKPCLVIEASDTSDNTHKRLSDKCSFYGIRHIRAEITMSELSDSVGKRSEVSSVGITDEGLATAILSKMPTPEN